MSDFLKLKNTENSNNKTMLYVGICWQYMFWEYFAKTADG